MLITQNIKESLSLINNEVCRKYNKRYRIYLRNFFNIVKMMRVHHQLNMKQQHQIMMTIHNKTDQIYFIS